MQIRARSAVCGRFLAGKRYPKRTWSDKSRVKIGVRKTCQTFFNQDCLIIWHRFISPVFFESPCSTSLYRSASSPTARGRQYWILVEMAAVSIPTLSINSQAAPLRARKSDLLVSFCRSFSCSNAYLHLSNKVPKWGVKAKVACQQWASFGQVWHAGWSYRIPRNPQQTIWDGTFKYEKSYFVETLMSLSQILGAKTPRGHTISMSYTVLQCLWLLMEYRFLGDLRMLKDWPCKWFKCPIEIHRKLTVAKEKMNKHWLKIFVNKWYVALFTFIYTYTYTVIYIAVYIAYPNILLVGPKDGAKHGSKS